MEFEGVHGLFIDEASGNHVDNLTHTVVGTCDIHVKTFYLFALHLNVHGVEKFTRLPLDGLIFTLTAKDIDIIDTDSSRYIGNTIDFGVLTKRHKSLD